VKQHTKSLYAKHISKQNIATLRFAPKQSNAKASYAKIQHAALQYNPNLVIIISGEHKYATN